MVSDNFGGVFSPIKIGNLEIPNRLVRSATYECRATEDGFVTDDLVKVYEALARGGAGLTITGMSYVRSDGNQLHRMIANYSDEHLEGLSRIAGAYHDAVKEVGNNSKIFLQLGHCGRQAMSSGYSGKEISSSATENKILQKIAKELTIEEIKDVAECFGEAARRARLAGFNGIQFHGAHGYLITQFYSPYMNHRGDEYGGSTHGRAKFVLDLLQECRKRVGNAFSITMKMNGSDRIPDGVDVDEASDLAEIFANAGFDALEISSCVWETLKYAKPISIPPEAEIKLRQRGREAYNLDLAKTIKEYLLRYKVEIPIMLVGGLYRFETIKSINLETNIDIYAMSRPLIRQPDLPSIWQSGPPFPEAECVHCNLCIHNANVQGLKFQGIRCIRQERDAKKASL